MSKSIVFVVGAGASKEANLPLGAELKHKIASALDFRFRHGLREGGGEDAIYDGLKRIDMPSGGFRKDINEYVRACRMLRDAMPQAASIDNFIDAHRGNLAVAAVGKLAIASCILTAEASSTMYVDRRNSYNKVDFRALEGSWYNELFRLLVQSCEVEEIPARLSRVAIITFNYDRCIEHYLHEGMMNYYGVSSEKAAELLSNLKIFHPYGSIGALPWSSPVNAFDFGATTDSWGLVSITQRLKTFTEGTDESHSEIKEIRSTLESAMKVAFVGFAYNKQNLELLFGKPPYIQRHRLVPVFGTALKISSSDIAVIKRELFSMGGFELTTLNLRQDLASSGLFQEFSRSLAID